jgi:hypothetical protein
MPTLDLTMYTRIAEEVEMRRIKGTLRGMGGNCFAGNSIPSAILPVLLFWIIAGLSLCAAAQKRVLVYTRNYTPDGKGYVHDNIQSSVDAIKKMGAESGFAVEVSDDPFVFTEINLKNYSALVFSNSNNQAFSSDAQRDAFKHYIESGGRLRRHSLRIRLRARLALLLVGAGGQICRAP